jgi:flavin reductase ActVB
MTTVDIARAVRRINMHTVTALDEQTFRDAMASFPSGVTVVTTVDRTGTWRGFTATSFCSVSADPPLVLVCLATDAECHQAFSEAEHWAVHVIGADQTDTALRFATRGADKFAGSGVTTGEHGLPLLEGGCVRMVCSAHASYTAGDHTILVGRVEDIRLREEPPAVYLRRSFAQVLS